MKKITAIVMAVVLLAAMAVSASATDFYAASAAVDKIVVDGIKDDAYVSDPIPIDYQAESGAATGVAHAAWDDQYLYVFVNVTDDDKQKPEDVFSMWYDDNVEFYINLSGTEGKIGEINAAQYTYGPSFFEFAGGGMHREKNVARSEEHTSELQSR